MTKEQMHEKSQALLAFAMEQATGTQDEEAECDGREVIAVLDAARFVMLTSMAAQGGLGAFFLGEAGDWEDGDWNGEEEEEIMEVEHA